MMIISEKYRIVPQWFSDLRLPHRHSAELMHPAFLRPPGSPLSAPPTPRSTPHLSMFFHCTPVLSQHSCMVYGFRLPLLPPHLPMCPLFPFPQNVPKSPTVLARDSMCFSCRYLFTAPPVSTHPHWWLLRNDVSWYLLIFSL